MDPKIMVIITKTKTANHFESGVLCLCGNIIVTIILFCFEDTTGNAHAY